MRTKLFFAAILIILTLIVYQAYHRFLYLESIDTYEKCLAEPTSIKTTTWPNSCEVIQLGKVFVPEITDDLLSDTSKWSTYHNDKFGYTISYPSSLVRLTENAGEKGYVDPSPNADILVFINNSDKINQWMWVRPYDDLPPNTSLEEFIKEKMFYRNGFLEPEYIEYSLALNEKVLELKTFTIDGKNVVKLVSQILPNQGATEEITFHAWIEYQPGKLIYLNDSQLAYHSQEYNDQILSTFKFSN